MTHDEAIKTVRDFIKTSSKWGVPGTRDALAALDSLADSKPLDPVIHAVVQDNFWELAGKTKTAEQSDDVEELCHQIYDILPISPCLKLLDDGKLCALITVHDHRIIEQYRKGWREQLDEAHADREARDERIRRECADRAVQAAYGFEATAEQDARLAEKLRAAIMGEAKK